jgi:IS5 family transposase
MQERKSGVGRKRINLPILLKMLILQQLSRLSHKELEFQANDRPPFDKFVRLGMMNGISPANTIAFLRKRFRKVNIIEELFKMFDILLRSQGLQARGARSLTQLLPLFPGKVMAARRTLQSKQEGY